MNDTQKKIKNELLELIHYGQSLYYQEAFNENKVDDESIEILKNSEEYIKFKKTYRNTIASYQTWYTKSILVIKQLLPNRLDEFKKLYIDEKRSAQEITFLNYNISDYLLGLRITSGWEKKEVVDRYGSFSVKFQQQLEILNSAYEIIDTKLFDIEGVLQSELFENELEIAKDILKKKHIRVAGALAGVTLEIHLKKVCKNHVIKFRKQNPTIADFNEELKNIGIIDIPTWRLIQRLGDIRNMSVHSKEREPTIDEVEDLIRGCEKLISEIL